MNIEKELAEVDPIPPWNFKWIVRKQLAIMGYPKSKENVRYLLDAGIVHLVSLSPEKQPPFEYFPFHFRWTPLDILEFDPPTLDQILAFINVCKVALHNNEAIGVHCRMGRGRSGVMAACYMVYFYDMLPWNALIAIRRSQPGSIETYSQEKAVHTYYDYLMSTENRPAEVDEVDLYISTLPRPRWDFKPRPRRIFDYEM